MTTAIDYSKLAQELIASSNKATGNASTITAHGPGGLLSPLGMSPGIANAMIMPLQGLSQVLPYRSSIDTNPLRGIFTGVTASTGSEPTNRCDDPPSAGVSQLCTTTSTWGWFGRSSREIPLDIIGRRVNRGEFNDMQLMGDPFAGGKSNPVPGGMAGALSSEIGKILFELGVAMVRDSAKDIYSGNPTNNVGTVGREGRGYYRGLELIADTGYRDAITGVACPAADPIITDFSAHIDDSGELMVRYFTYMLRNLRWIAVQTGLGEGTVWTVAMRSSLFYELTAIWPCSYQTYRCSVDGTNNRAVSSREVLNQMTDDMRAGKYLLVDGMRVSVTVDNSITETEAEAGIFTSDIFFVPLRSEAGSGSAPLSEGGSTLSYMEYFNFGNDDATQVRMAMAPDGMYQVSGNGRYLFHKQPPKNLCMKFVGWCQERLVVETTYLLGRISNVSYTPLLHERDAFPGDPYFVNGGREDYVGYGPSYYSPTA